VCSSDLEFLALAASLEHLAVVTGNAAAKIMADTLDRATGRFLESNKGPSRKCGEIDNRGSHFYLALYWARELAGQDGDAGLRNRFAALATALEENENLIAAELLAAQGSPMNIGGYYRPDTILATKAMRPSPTFNAILDAF